MYTSAILNLLNSQLHCAHRIIDIRIVKASAINATKGDVK